MTLALATMLRMAIVYAIALGIYAWTSPSVDEWRRLRAMRRQLRRNGLQLPRVVVLRRRGAR